MSFIPQLSNTANDFKIYHRMEFQKFALNDFVHAVVLPVNILYQSM